MGEYKLKAYLAMQMREITEHKYYLSQEYGYDVGYDFAIKDWIRFHAQRFRTTYFKHIDLINRICEEKCGSECKDGIEGCILSLKDIHLILED